MNPRETPDQNGPSPEDPKDLRRELRALVMKAHPDRIPKELRPRAESLIRILTTLLDEAKKGNAIRTWSDLAAPGQSAATYKEGDSLELVRVDDSGEVHGGQVQLPKWTKVFRNALNAFFAGQSIEEVKHILNFDPVAADRVARRELNAVITSAPTVDELIKTQDKILESKVLLDKSRQDLLREVVGRIVGAYSQPLAQAAQLSNLTSLSNEVKQLIEQASLAAKNDKDYFLGALSMIIDVHAESIAGGMLENPDDKKKLDAIAGFITAVGGFTFADQRKKDDLLQRGNDTAREILMESMKRTRSEKGLERLYEYVYRFPFSPDDAGEAIRAEIHHWIEKKWYSYLSPEAQEAQAIMGSSSQS